MNTQKLNIFEVPVAISSGKVVEATVQAQMEPRSNLIGEFPTHHDFLEAY
jgi:hypothetical protein